MDALESRRLLSATLVGEYLFDEIDGGTTVVDTSGTDNHGTFDVGVMRDYGWDGGGALYLDGSGAVTTNLDLNQWLGESASLTAWVWTNEYGSYDFWRSPGITGVEVDPHADDVFWGVLSGSGGIGVQAGNGPGAYGWGVNWGWTHVAFTRDMDSGAVRTYINGYLAQAADGPTGAKTTPFNTIGGVEVLDFVTGARRQPNYWIGGLDDVRIYDGVLSHNEVRAQLGLPPLPDPVVGTGTGLLGTYTDPWSGATAERLDPTVNFTWPAAPHPAIPPDGFEVVWEGFIEGQVPEEYMLSVIADDEMSVFIDGEEILRTSFFAPWMQYAFYPITLNPGQPRSIRIEMREYGGLAQAQLYWSTPSTPTEIVPQTQLYPLRAPVIVTSAAITGPTSGTEGREIMLDGAGVGIDPLEFAWAVRRGNSIVASGAGEDFTFTPDDDGLYEVALTVTADDGSTATAYHNVSVSNVVPILTASGSTTTVEGANYVLDLAASDPGADSIRRWLIDWGDGSDPDGDGVVGETIDGSLVSATHQFPDDGQYAISVRGEDEDGTYDANLGTQYFATQTWGTWTMLAADAAAAGGYLVSINDAEEQALIESLFVTPFEAFWIGLTDVEEEGVYRWSDGTLATYTNWNLETGEPNNYWGPGSEDYGALNFQWAYGHSGQPGTWNDMLNDQYYFRGIVEVPGADPLVVTAVNADPEASIVAPSSAVRGQTVSLAGVLSDAGVIDAHEVSWTTSDGTVIGPHSADDPGALELSHSFSSAGTYTVTLEVWDDDGGHASVTHVIEVKVVDLQQDPSDPTKTVLAVGGTDGNDRIHVELGGDGAIAVTIGDALFGTFAAPNGSTFGTVLVLGNSGDDHVTLGGEPAVGAVLDGGDGNDHLKGGRGNDLLLGGAGDDLLNGAFGADTAVGGDGDDLIVNIEVDAPALPGEARTWLERLRRSRSQAAARA